MRTMRQYQKEAVVSRILKEAVSLFEEFLMNKLTGELCLLKYDIKLWKYSITYPYHRD